MTRHGPPRLTLHGMRFFGRIGHAEPERVVGTHVEVDVELTLALPEGPVHALEGTVDYRSVHDAVRHVVEQGDHPLLEGLAAEVLDALEGFPWTQLVVRVRKPNPPFRGHVAFAQVELSRSRDA